MSGDAELLNFIYQNSQMGVDTIRQLIGVVEDKDLKEHLKTQFQGYEELRRQEDACYSLRTLLNRMLRRTGTPSLRN